MNKRIKKKKHLYPFSEYGLLVKLNISDGKDIEDIVNKNTISALQRDSIIEIVYYIGKKDKDFNQKLKELDTFDKFIHKKVIDLWNDKDYKCYGS
jgi:hypothetical protein